MNQDFNLEESQKLLMQLLVSRTLKKHNVNTEELNLSDKEKQNLKDMVQHFQQEFEHLMNKEIKITENDIDPRTNTYEENNQKK